MNAFHTRLLIAVLGVCFPNAWAVLAGDSEPQVWTTTRLVKEGGKQLWDNSTEFVVEFQVASVRRVPTILVDGTRRQVGHLVPVDSDDFTVPVSEEVEKALGGKGVTSLDDYFTGKTVKVRGKVSQTGLELIGSETIWTFHITLRSLDQLLEVRPVSSGGTSGGTELDEVDPSGEAPPGT